jgi:hypothetical protein
LSERRHTTRLRPAWSAPGNETKFSEYGRSYKVFWSDRQAIAATCGLRATRSPSPCACPSAGRSARTQYPRDMAGSSLITATRPIRRPPAPLPAPTLHGACASPHHRQCDATDHWSAPIIADRRTSFLCTRPHACRTLCKRNGVTCTLRTERGLQFLAALI